MDWMCIIVNESAEEEEMSSLAVRFAVRMHKGAIGSEGETILRSCAKQSRSSSLDEEAQKD